MLSAMWGVLYTYAAQNNLSPAITLSDGLEMNETLPGLKITFIVFVVLLGIATIPIVLAVIYYTVDIEAHAPLLNKWYRTKWHLNLALCSVVFVVCACAKVIFLALVAAYDVGSEHTLHYIFAATAFSLCLLGNLMLLLRRWFVLKFLTFKQEYYEAKRREPTTKGLLEEDKPSFMQNDHDYKKALGIIVVVNTVFFLFELACAIIFVNTGDGRAECALTFLIVADMLFQPFDFYFDKASLGKHDLIVPSAPRGALPLPAG